MPPDKRLTGHEPIDPDEVVYRRALPSQYLKPADFLFPAAFQPRPSDTDGISICRANYLESPEDACRFGLETIQYWVVELRAGQLIDIGMELTPTPSTNFIGHASSPILRADTIGHDKTLLIMEAASRIQPRKIYGPFVGKIPKKRK